MDDAKRLCLASNTSTHKQAWFGMKYEFSCTVQE